MMVVEENNRPAAIDVVRGAAEPAASGGITTCTDKRKVGGVTARFVSFTLFVFFATTLVVPSAVANKLAFAVLLLIVAMTPAVMLRNARVRTVAPLLILCVFVYGYAAAGFHGSDEELAGQLALSATVLLLIYVVEWFEIDLDFIVKSAGVVLCAFTGVFFYYVVIQKDSSLGHYFLENFKQYSLGSMGQRDIAGGPAFMFRMGTTPFLFVPFAVFFMAYLERRYWRDLIGALLTGLVMVVSTSRALILGSLLVVCVLVISRLRLKSKAIAACILAGLAAIGAQVLATNTAVFSATESSNSIKIGHATSFLESLSLRQLFIGEGLGAYYFSVGRNAFVSQTEITPFDLVRYFGLPLTLLVYAALLLPSMRAYVWRSNRGVYVSIFALYLLMSATNPILVNSYGFLVVIWYWSKVLGKSERIGAAAGRSGILQ